MRRGVETGVMVASLGLLAWIVSERLMPVRPDGGWRAVPAELRDAPMSPFGIVSLDGDTIDLPADGVRTTVVGYRTTCPFCGLSAARWSRIPDRSCGTLLVFVSVESVGAQREFWSSRAEGPPESPCSRVVVGRPVDEARYRAATLIRSVPQHILIDERGRADAVWMGPLGSRASLDRLIQRIVTRPGGSSR